MKGTQVLSDALNAISRLIGIIYSWLNILFDWTDEAKKVSDSAIERYRREKDVYDTIANAELEEELEKALKKAGIERVKED